MPPDSPSSTDGAGREWVLKWLAETNVEDVVEALLEDPSLLSTIKLALEAERERTRVLEEALRRIVERTADGGDLRGRHQLAGEIHDINNIARASLAAVAVEDGGEGR